MHIDTSSFALKSNLSSLKTAVDKSDIDKLMLVPVDLSKLIDLVRNDVVKKNCTLQIVAKRNIIDTSRFSLKTKYNTDKSDAENKVSDTSGLVKKTNFNAKIT